jgi:hypothetical protein
LQKLIASRRLTYAGRRLDPGDEFDASDRDAKTLAVIGSARYATRMMSAETTGRTLHLPAAKRKRGRPPKAKAE